jgi:hypothetical protein
METLGRLTSAGAKLTGQPAAYVAYFLFAGTYIWLVSNGIECPPDFKVILYMLTGWFFANSTTWRILNGQEEKENVNI